MGVGPSSHERQTGHMLMRIEEVLSAEKPNRGLANGDTDSTMAGALPALKLHIPVAHVEPGPRSFNRYMPEEINRLVTNLVSTLPFCPTETAVNNLRKEGFTNVASGVCLIGNSFSSLVALHWSCDAG